MSLCPQCSSPLPEPQARFCSRCGAAIPPVSPSPRPVHIERRGSLWNARFIASVLILIAGGLLAGFGQVVPGGILLIIGVPLMLIVTVRSLSR